MTARLVTAIERVTEAINRLADATAADEKSERDDTEQCARCSRTAREVDGAYRRVGFDALVCPVAMSQVAAGYRNAGYTVGHEWPSDQGERARSRAGSRRR